MVISKAVEINTTIKSFVYFDKLPDGTFRATYTSDNAEFVRDLRDTQVIQRAMDNDE